MYDIPSQHDQTQEQADDCQWPPSAEKSHSVDAESFHHTDELHQGDKDQEIDYYWLAGLGVLGLDGTHSRAVIGSAMNWKFLHGNVDRSTYRKTEAYHWAWTLRHSLRIVSVTNSISAKFFEVGLSVLIGFWSLLLRWLRSGGGIGAASAPLADDYGNGNCGAYFNVMSWP
jgi:hypothetical protein